MNNDDNMTCMEWTQGSRIVTTEILAGRDGCEPAHLGSAGPGDMSVTWWDPDSTPPLRLSPQGHEKWSMHEAWSCKGNWKLNLVKTSRRS